MVKDPYRYFRIEARELLDGLSQGVLGLERGTGPKELIGRLLRLAHTLKGASRVVRHTAIADLAHAVEDVLAPYREGEGTVGPDGVGELLRLLDAITSHLASLEPAEGRGVAPAAREPTEEPFESVRITLGEMDALLEAVSELVVQLTEVSRETSTIERARQLAGALVEELGPKRLGPAHATGSMAAGRAQYVAEELRDLLERAQRRLGIGMEQVDSELAQVREAANQLRLLPASAVFGSAERAAHDAAQTLGKSIQLAVQGGEHRLDAHVLAGLRDALMHVVRNAVAHGIEPREERVSAGKPPAGRIELTVERRGHRVALSCRDDGRGIDVQAVRRQALRRGRISAAESESLGMDGAVRMLLEGGISTSDGVTVVSGRGIGLDVVRETAVRLKGEVSIRSEPGRGTTVEICVPVSLSSVPALWMEAGGVAACLPLDAVETTRRIADSEIARSADQDSIVHEGKVIPFVPLARAVSSDTAPRIARRSWSAVVLHDGRALAAALGVDRLLGTANVVMRPIPARAGVDPVVAGASFDAEGNPQLVLDPAGIIALARAGRGAFIEPCAAPRLPVLVIDDSLTTRMLEQSILESAGYEVELATSAEEALAMARQRRYAVFIVDVEMPGMSGLEFVQKTRMEPALSEVPALLVTSRDGPEDRHRGKEVGARAYIVKSEFDQQHLLQTIRGLVG